MGCVSDVFGSLLLIKPLFLYVPTSTDTGNLNIEGRLAPLFDLLLVL